MLAPDRLRAVRPFFLAFVWIARAALAGLELDASPTEVKPGDVVLVTARQAPAEPSGSIGGRALKFYRARRGTYRAIAPLPLEEPLGNLEIKISAADANKPEGNETVVKAISVVEPGFPSRELSVDNKFLEPPPSVKKRIAADAAAIASAFDQPFSRPIFSGDFTWPRTSEITAHFGDRRVFNGKTESQHYGIDLEGKVGDPVAATNSGVVVLARDCYSSGKTILIHHGAGVFSAYFHLTAMAVRKGQRVKRGQRIGLVGKSGRVTGPHLHFGIKVAGLYVNPESVLHLRFD
jgi:murein DD-endopeptidase MepM/ murein hydrolase activator NlpD